MKKENRCCMHCGLLFEAEEDEIYCSINCEIEEDRVNKISAEMMYDSFRIEENFE